MKKSITAVSVDSLSKRDTQISILLVALLFFIIGFVSWVNAILIHYFKIPCELTNFQAYFVADTHDTNTLRRTVLRAQHSNVGVYSSLQNSQTSPKCEQAK